MVPQRARRWALLVLHDAPSVLAVLTVAGLAAGVDGTVTAWLIAGNIAVHPGAAIVSRLGPLTPSATAAAHLSIGIAAWSLLAHVMLSLRIWSPAAGAALLIIASAAARLELLTRHSAKRSLEPATASASASARLRRANQLHLAVVAIGCALWWWVTTRVVEPPSGLGGWARELPIGWYVAALLLTLAAAHAVLAQTPNDINVAVSLGALVAVVYLTPALTTSTIRYPWSYKHLGVIRLFDETGRLHEGVDVYQTFSGAFGLGALVRGAADVDLTTPARWAQAVGELLVLTAVIALLTAVSRSRRVAYLGALVYLLTNWVGQNYFAPQTLAMFMAVTVLALTVTWFSRSAPRVDRRTQTARAALVGSLVFGILLIHPLTPLAVLAPLALAWAVGLVRDIRLAIAVGAALAAWAARNASFLIDNIGDLGFGGSVSQNAAGNSAALAPPAEAMAITQATRLFSAVVWGLAGCGALLAVWARRRVSWAVLIGIAPFAIPLVQSYGGEAIYRVYLYSLPIVAGLIAWGVCCLAPVERRGVGHTVFAGAMLGALLLGMVTVHYGREHINRVDADEVAMADHVGATVAGPTLVAQFSSGYPAQSTANYPDHQISPTYTPYVAEMLADIRRDRPRLDLAQALGEVADDLRALAEQTPFVVVSPGMIDVVQTFGTWPIADVDEAAQILLDHPRFELRHRIGTTSLFAVVPPASTDTPTGPPTTGSPVTVEKA